MIARRHRGMPAHSHTYEFSHTRYSYKSKTSSILLFWKQWMTRKNRWKRSSRVRKGWSRLWISWRCRPISLSSRRHSRSQQLRARISWWMILTSHQRPTTNSHCLLRLWLRCNQSSMRCQRLNQIGKPSSISNKKWQDRVTSLISRLLSKLEARLRNSFKRI